ncbi:MAG: hypothetical protein JXR59_09790 [Desulfuromonadaceae bacterium]|nr:hypothetical protein [Desulfuromonadaceae bacterium]
MSVSSVTSSTLSSYTTSTGSTLNQGDFLTLLVAQLENQDPLEPQSNTEFIAQMAQFSSLEQQIDTNEKLDSLLSTNQSIETLSSFSLLGQNVVAEQDSFTLADESIELGFSLEQPAESVSLAILNAEGSVVDTLEVEDVAEGMSFVSWDGQDSAGNALPTADYSCVVTACYSDNTTETLATLQRATVTGIDTSNGTAIDTDQGSFELTNLVSIAAN